MSASATTSDNKSGENNNSAKATGPSKLSKYSTYLRNVMIEDWNFDDGDDEDDDDDQEIGVNYTLKRKADNTPQSLNVTTSTSTS